MLMVLVGFAWFAPSLWYVHQHGANTAVARQAAESELYGMKLTGLLPARVRRHSKIAPVTRSCRAPSCARGDA